MADDNAGVAIVLATGGLLASGALVVSAFVARQAARDAEEAKKRSEEEERSRRKEQELRSATEAYWKRLNNNEGVEIRIVRKCPASSTPQTSITLAWLYGKVGYVC